MINTRAGRHIHVPHQHESARGQALVLRRPHDDPWRAGERPFFGLCPVQTDKTADALQRDPRGAHGHDTARDRDLPRSSRRVKTINVLSLPGRWETRPAPSQRRCRRACASVSPDDYWAHYADGRARRGAARRPAGREELRFTPDGAWSTSSSGTAQGSEGRFAQARVRRPARDKRRRRGHVAWFYGWFEVSRQRHRHLLLQQWPGDLRAPEPGAPPEWSPSAPARPGIGRATSVTFGCDRVPRAVRRRARRPLRRRCA